MLALVLVLLALVLLLVLVVVVVLQPVDDHPLSLAQTSRWCTYFKVGGHDGPGMCGELAWHGPSWQAGVYQHAHPPVPHMRSLPPAPHVR